MPVIRYKIGELETTLFILEIFPESHRGGSASVKDIVKSMLQQICLVKECIKLTAGSMWRTIQTKRKNEKNLNSFHLLFIEKIARGVFV